MAFFDSPFNAEVVNKRIEGNGSYTFPDGNVYVGEMKDGQFHGKGTIHYKTGGRYDANWEKGIAIDGKYTFQDGLKYEVKNWEYCTPADRRFFSEQVNGFVSGEPKLVNGD